MAWNLKRLGFPRCFRQVTEHCPGRRTWSAQTGTSIERKGRRADPRGSGPGTVKPCLEHRPSTPLLDRRCRDLGV